jgi:UDP-N-acetylmuramate dehydrogenase
MAFSQKHANFLINLGDGSYKEAISLIKKAQDRVLAETGIFLTPEIHIIKNQFI